MILAAQRRLYDRSPSHLREGTPGRHSTPKTVHTRNLTGHETDASPGAEVDCAYCLV